MSRKLAGISFETDWDKCNLRFWKTWWPFCPKLCIGGSRTAARFKVELFVMIVNGWKPLTIITKSSTLDVITVLGCLCYVEHIKKVNFNVICVCFRQVFIKNLKVVWFGRRYILPTTTGLVFGNNNQKKNFFYVFRETWFNIITKIISDIASYSSSMSVSVTTREVILIDLNFQCKHRII